MNTVIVRQLGLVDYLTTWQAMQAFTNQRTPETQDEMWVLEHPPVFTQGQNGKAEHILDAGSIPIIPVDRGGQVTYHGPGQLVVYTLIDVKRKKLNVRQLVNHLENTIIEYLASRGITATAQCNAPGVYVAEKKICSVGLRIRRWCSYHGLAFNINMDLKPFSRINPCGYAGMQITQLADFIPTPDFQTVTTQVLETLCKNLGYTTPLITTEHWHAI